ncbi:hypothetical protein [Numidum massiliense]|nr:hypothetical protein [Numidum massiliense]
MSWRLTLTITAITPPSPTIHATCHLPLIGAAQSSTAPEFQFPSVSR